MSEYSEYTTEYVNKFYTENTNEVNNIITIEIQKMIQEYADENRLIDLNCNHVFELPRIIRYYGTMFDNNNADNYRKSYIVMDFYCYDYKYQQVYKGKEMKGGVVFKINPGGIKITNNYTFINFLER